jgi:hypothetical protein
VGSELSCGSIFRAFISLALMVEVPLATVTAGQAVEDTAREVVQDAVETTATRF